MSIFGELDRRRRAELATIVCKHAGPLSTLRVGVVVRRTRKWKVLGYRNRRPDTHASYRFVPCIYKCVCSKRGNRHRLVIEEELSPRWAEESARLTLRERCPEVPVLGHLWKKSLTNLNETQIAAWFNDISIPGPSF